MGEYNPNSQTQIDKCLRAGIDISQKPELETYKDYYKRKMGERFGDLSDLTSRIQALEAKMIEYDAIVHNIKFYMPHLSEASEAEAIEPVPVELPTVDDTCQQETSVEVEAEQVTEVDDNTEPESEQVGWTPERTRAYLDAKTQEEADAIIAKVNGTTKPTQGDGVVVTPKKQWG